MGTINRDGVLCGRIGPVVAASWNGINYLRSLPRHYKDKKSKKQICQRNKFTMVFRLLQRMKEYLRVGFKPMAYHQSAFNAAMSHNLQNVIINRKGQSEIDYSRLCLSIGTLPNAFSMKVERAFGQILISWTDNSNIGVAQKNDIARPLVYNIDKQQVLFTSESIRSIEPLDAFSPSEFSMVIERRVGGLAVVLPDSWAGDRLAVYMSFTSADGNNVSISSYLGTIRAFDPFVNGFGKYTNTRGVKEKDLSKVSDEEVPFNIRT